MSYLFWPCCSPPTAPVHQSCTVVTVVYDEEQRQWPCICLLSFCQCLVLWFNLIHPTSSSTNLELLTVKEYPHFNHMMIHFNKLIHKHRQQMWKVFCFIPNIYLVLCHSIYTPTLIILLIFYDMKLYLKSLCILVSGSSFCCYTLTSVSLIFWCWVLWHMCHEAGQKDRVFKAFI